MGRMLDWGILGLGFDLLFGWTGLLSFGQAAFFGTGGFVAAYLLVNHVIGSVWIALAVGTVAAGVFGLMVGWLAVRRIGIYFAMITLAFGQMSYFLENSPLSAYTGGENGLPGVPVPGSGSVPWRIAIQPGCRCTGCWRRCSWPAFLARRITHSPFGAILRAIKENTPRAAMLGHAVPATSSPPSSSRRCLLASPADCWACCKASCRPMHSHWTLRASLSCRRLLVALAR